MTGLDELKNMTKKKLAAMTRSGIKLQYGSQLYDDYCKTIDKIREQYISYNDSIKAFNFAIGTDDEDKARKQLEQTMSLPEGWVLQALASDSEWLAMIDENNDPAP